MNKNIIVLEQPIDLGPTKWSNKRAFNVRVAFIMPDGVRVENARGVYVETDDPVTLAGFEASLEYQLAVEVAGYVPQPVFSLDSTNQTSEVVPGLVIGGI